MRNASFSSLLAGTFGAALLVLPGCSGSSSGDASSVRIRCLGGQSFCIISCDLGCTQTGCAVSEIAENQRVHVKFSDRVDPHSVNGASFSIRTATGVAPDGDYTVVDSEVTFVPKVRTVAGVSTFGFLRNESYIITLAGGNTAAQGIHDLSNNRLTQEFTCTVRASLGIQDEDQQAPTVEMTAPASPINVPLDPTIVLRFSELIDTTALQSPLSSSSPIRVVLRGTLPNGLCDRDAEGTALEGLPQLSTEIVGGHDVTVVTFRPNVTLPGQSCITVYVTSDLRDLSGRAAVPTQFELITVAGVATPITLVEAFATSAGQEELVSGGVWLDGARPAQIGSDGRHGSFQPNFGTPQGSGVFLWNLDTVGGITIPASNTPSGQQFSVTDGRFFFTDFVLNDGQVLKFSGSVPPQIYVRGKCEIRGIIDLSAVDMPATVPLTGPLAGQRVSTFNARGNPMTIQVFGQPGGVGGCGGGNGGDGGRESLGTGQIIVAGVNVTNGQPGQTVKVLASHAYAGLAGGTGGAGSEMNPANGLTASAAAPFIVATLQYRDEFSRGGGGGGFMLPGGAPTLPTIPPPATVQPANGPAVAGGVAFPLAPTSVPPQPYQSLTHFLVGGSGGGGGGCHTFGIASVLADVFMAGHGGSGGGGAIALRAGGDLTLFGTGQILVRGGRGVVINADNPLTTTQDVDFGASSPGGGGSGGSVLLQSARAVTVQGLLDATGGNGSRTQGVAVFSLAPTQLNVLSQAGAGSSGFYRLEGGTAVNFTGPVATTPPFVVGTNSGPLLDEDALSGDLSKWRSTGLIFPPTWVRYELDVDTDGDGVVDITYTDSGDPGTQKANDPAGPLTIQFQGALMAQNGTTPIPGTIKPWREGIGSGAGPGIQQDSVTGFRFTLTYNRAAFPGQVVKALRVFAHT